MKWICFVLVLTFLSKFSLAASTSFSRAGFDITVEPIVGYEQFHRNDPTPHAKLMLIYGARATAGKRWLAAEGEFTRGSDTEVFASPAQTIKTELQNAKLGLRTTQSIVGRLSGFIRGGAQASQVKTETTTVSGLTSTTVTSTGKWKIRAYAGLGLEIAVSQRFSLAFEGTYILNSTSNLKENDLQGTTAFRIHL